jgi:4-methyl-5(b-hydroxyethyl)-thiazole monophosphate biosynthesis
MEAVIIVDVLRRAGWQVATAGVTGRPVTASRGVQLVPDQAWPDAPGDTFDALVLPGGGPGTKALAAHPGVLGAVRRFIGENRLVGAICAAPLVLQAAGVLSGRRVTCHPGVAAELTATPRLPDRVVVDGSLVTSQGPGTAFEFALTLVRIRDGAPTADRLAREMVLQS